MKSLRTIAKQRSFQPLFLCGIFARSLSVQLPYNRCSKVIIILELAKYLLLLLCTFPTIGNLGSDGSVGAFPFYRLFLFPQISLPSYMDYLTIVFLSLAIACLGLILIFLCLQWPKRF